MKSRVCGPITSTQSLTVWFYFSFSLSTGSSLDGKVGRPTRVRERGGGGTERRCGGGGGGGDGCDGEEDGIGIDGGSGG